MLQNLQNVLTYKKWNVVSIQYVTVGMRGGASGGAVAAEEQRRGRRRHHVTRSPSHSAIVLIEWMSQWVSDSCIATASPVARRSRWTTCEPDPAPLES